MTLTDSGKEALIPVLLSFIESPEFFSVKKFFTPSLANSIIQQLLLNNHRIKDKYIDDLFSIILTYVNGADSGIEKDLLSDEELKYIKHEKESLESLIQQIEVYASQNDILLSKPTSL